VRPSRERGARRAATRPGLRVLGAVAAIAAGIAIGAQQTHLIDGLEHDSLRARFSLRDAPRHSGVAVVAIDDATFAELKQQWPFKRSLHGHVIDRLHAAGAREIVYDVQFTEPTIPREDGALYDALARSGGAVLVTGETDGHGHTNVLGGDANLRAAHSRAAAGDLVNDPSGAITQFPRSAGGVDSVPVVAAERATGRKLPPGSFADGKAWIDYRGGPGAIRTVPFAAVLRGRFDPAWFRGKVVVVGATTPTLQDVHPTPVGGAELMAGPEVEANAIATALDGDPLRSAPPATGWILVALMALVAPLLRLRLGIVASTVFAALVGCAYLAAVQLAFDSGTVLTALAPLLALVTGAVGTIVASHLAESFERRRVARSNAILEARVRERTAELRDTQLEVIRRLGAAVESRDQETGLHIARMSRLCHRLALATGMDPAEADRLRHACAMHDIGKIGIPDRILQKPGKLDHDEWEVMKTHTTIGAHILSGSRAPLIRMAETIALTHHERWDGSGYPGGIAGEEIPLVGRITSICDVFDALISERPYKHAWTVDEALAEIARQSGRQFDPGLVEPFLTLARDTPPIRAAADVSDFPAELLLAPRPEADRRQT
jgi:HD-GYP domain-containing protein (c-di-GMP phosphodiesterase class II)